MTSAVCHNTLNLAECSSVMVLNKGLDGLIGG